MTDKESLMGCARLQVRWQVVQVLLVFSTAACRPPGPGEPLDDTDTNESIDDTSESIDDTSEPEDSGRDTGDTGQDTGEPKEEDIPCDSPRQAWAPAELQGHTPWFLHAGERVLLGTVHDTDPAHILERLEGELVDLGAPSETETAIWQIVEVDGDWFGGTYPHAKLVRQDEDLGSLWDGASSAYTLAAANGWVYAGLGPERAALAAYEIATGETQVLEGTSTAAYGEVHLGSDGVVYGLLDGQAYRFSEDEALPVAAVVEAAPLESRGLWVEQVESEDPASLQLAIQLRDMETWEAFTSELSFEGRGLSIHALGASDGLVVGGTLLPNEIFSFREGTLEHLGHVGDGEMYSILVGESQVWMAEYPSGNLWIFDASSPWDLGTNPAAIALGEGHLRPLALEAGEDGTMWVGSVAGYGVTGGALARVQDGVATNHRAPFEEMGVSALAWDAETGWLAVAADGLWLWDAAGEQVAHTLEITTPWVMEAVDGVLYAMTWEMELFVVDLATQEVLHSQSTGLGNSRRHALWLHEGQLWGVADWGLYTVDLDDYTVIEQAIAPVTIDVGGALVDGRIYLGSGASLWSVLLETLEFEEVGEPVDAADVYDFGATGDDLVALLKAGDTLSLLSVEICEPERSEVVEVLDNGDFEAGTEGWSDWGGAWGEATGVTEPVHGGESALKITAGSSGGYAFQTIDPDLGGEVVAGAWIWLPADDAPERLQFELWLYGIDSYVWGRTELDLSAYPREEWVLLGPFSGTITPGYTDSYVHLGVHGEVGSAAFFDDVSVRRYE
jgi:hypothetical protein